MAINSIFHGSIHNISSENQHVVYKVDILKIPTEPGLILTTVEDGSIAKVSERVTESLS